MIFRQGQRQPDYFRPIAKAGMFPQRGELLVPCLPDLPGDRRPQLTDGINQRRQIFDDRFDAGHLPGNEFLAQYFHLGLQAPLQAPMAIVILGGLITATFLNLVVVPVLYVKWGRVGRAPVQSN